MTGFTNLPPEILESIAEEVGGRNLRRNVDNILLNRQWYDAARAVYNSGLDVIDLNVCGPRIEKYMEARQSPKRLRLMHKNTREVTMKFTGIWLDERSQKILTIPTFWTSSRRNRPPVDDRIRQSLQISGWWRRTTLHPSIQVLFQDLEHFEVLEHIKFETSRNEQEIGVPHFPWMTSDLIEYLFSNLPLHHSLKELTLDLLSGVSYSDGGDFHLCERLSPLLHRLEAVRLRLPTICPLLLKLPQGVQCDEIRLKSLAIRLYLPLTSGNDVLAAKCCALARNDFGLENERHTSMVHAGRKYAESIAAVPCRSIGEGSVSYHEPNMDHSQGLDVVRMSYVPSNDNVLHIFDCISGRVSRHPGQVRVLNNEAYGDLSKRSNTKYWIEEERGLYEKSSSREALY